MSKNDFEITARPLPTGLSLKSLISPMAPLEKMGTFTSLYIENLVHFADHPFKLYSEEKLQELAESIKQSGIINPVVVRKIKDSGEYEILSGHNRTEAARIAGLMDIPSRVVDVDDDTARLIVTESNLLQREKLLPSEKGKAYKMQLDALKRQGKRTDLTQMVDDANNLETSVPMEQKLTRSLVAERNKESSTQIQRYIRLNSLVPELMESVDEESVPFRAGVELSYLLIEEQQNLAILLATNDAYKVNLETAEILKTLSKSGQLDRTRIKQVLEGENNLNPPKERQPKETTPYDRVIKKVNTYLKKLPVMNTEAHVDEAALEAVIIQAIKQYIEAQ